MIGTDSPNMHLWKRQGRFFNLKTRPECDKRHHLCCYNHAIGEQRLTYWKPKAYLLAFKSIVIEQQYRRKRWKNDEQIAYQPCNQQLAKVVHFGHIWRHGVSCSPTNEFWRGCCKENFESFRFFILQEFSDEITAAFKNFPYICQHQTIFGTQWTTKILLCSHITTTSIS